MEGKGREQGWAWGKLNRSDRSQPTLGSSRAYIVPQSHPWRAEMAGPLHPPCGQSQGWAGLEEVIVIGKMPACS